MSTIPEPIGCPFCSNHIAEVMSEPTDASELYVVCRVCGATGPTVKAEIKGILPAAIKAVELWNKRGKHGSDNP